MTCKIEHEDTYIAVKDCMDSIHKVNAEEFVRDFPSDRRNNFSLSLDPKIFEIYSNLKYEGHSGASYACTLRECQYFLSYPNEWEAVLEYWKTVGR